MKAVPIASQIHKYTRYKKNKAYCFTTVDGTGRCCANMSSSIFYLWSLKAKTLSDQPNSGVHQAADPITYAISMRWLLIPSKENDSVFVRWVGGIWCDDVNMLDKITAIAMAKTNSQDFSRPNPRDQNAGIHPVLRG